jgi:hypothetical protein
VLLKPLTPTLLCTRLGRLKRDVSARRMYAAHGTGHLIREAGTNRWMNTLHEYADGLFAGVGLPPDQKEIAASGAVDTLHENPNAAMANADREVTRASGHECTDTCETWERGVETASRRAL